MLCIAFYLNLQLKYVVKYVFLFGYKYGAGTRKYP